jgi:hypothetical protein
MGEFRFLAPNNWNLDPYHANSIHLVGLDGIPWPCRIAVSEPAETEVNREFSVTRNQDDSARVYTIFDFANRGEQLICTGTLPVCDTPYHLLIELARGTLNRLRNQVSIWIEGGLVVESVVGEQIKAATDLLGESVFCQDADQTNELARQSTEKSMDAIFALAQTFSQQIADFRSQHQDLPKFWIANNVGSGEQFQASTEWPHSDLVSGPIRLDEPTSTETDPDRTLEYPGANCGRFEACGKRVIVGPLLDAGIGGMPERLIRVDDFLARRDKLVIECQQMLDQLPSTTSLIHLVSGLNGTGHRHLSYPQQLQVTVDLLRTVEESNSEVPAMVSFDFPWAERLAGAVGGIHPLQIADSLLRQGVNISFLGLDINLDYWPNGSAIRDPLQWIDLVDIWAQLGLPLVLCLRSPFQRNFHQSNPNDNQSPDAASPQRRRSGSQNSVCSNISDDQRSEFLRTVLPMMVARPSVHGLILRQWQDFDDARYPNGGLVDVTGKTKPIAAVVQHLRKFIDE